MINLFELDVLRLNRGLRLFESAIFGTAVALVRVYYGIFLFVHELVALICDVSTDCESYFIAGLGDLILNEGETAELLKHLL